MVFCWVKIKYVCKDIDVLFEYLNIKMTSPPLYKFWINIQLTVNQVSIWRICVDVVHKWWWIDHCHWKAIKLKFIIKLMFKHWSEICRKVLELCSESWPRPKIRVLKIRHNFELDWQTDKHWKMLREAFCVNGVNLISEFWI